MLDEVEIFRFWFQFVCNSHSRARNKIFEITWKKRSCIYSKRFKSILIRSRISIFSPFIICRMNTTFNANNSALAPVCPLSQWTFLGSFSQLLAYSVIFLLSIFGNCVLITALCGNYGRCHAVMRYYIVNMAAADLLTTVVNIGVQVYHYALLVMNKQFVWLVDGITGVALCKMFAFLQGTGIACSVFTLIAIATNRFRAVVFPFQRTMRNSRAYLVITVVWISAFATASPMLYAMRLKNGNEASYCVEDWEPLNQSSPAHYTLVLFFSLYLCPLLLLAFLYSIIALKVWGRTAPGQTTAVNQVIEMERKKKITMICMTVVLVFSLCWLPFYIYMILQFVGAFNDGCNAPEYLAFLGLFFGHANSAINPFIYIIYNSDYQRGVKKVLSSCSCPWKSNKLRMRTSRSTLESLPSQRTFKELELTSIKKHFLGQPSGNWLNDFLPRLTVRFTACGLINIMPLNFRTNSRSETVVWVVKTLTTEWKPKNGFESKARLNRSRYNLNCFIFSRFRLWLRTALTIRQKVLNVTFERIN